MHDWAKVKPWEQSRLENIKRRRRNNKYLLMVAVVISFWLGWAAQSFACGDTSTQCIACEIQGTAL